MQLSNRINLLTMSPIDLTRVLLTVLRTVNVELLALSRAVRPVVSLATRPTTASLEQSVVLSWAALLKML